MDYIVGEVLYTGAETRVVRGAHPGSGAQVVIKLPRQATPAPQTLEALRHEYTLLRAIDARGVIRALGLEPHGQGLSLVLEAWGETSLNRVLAARGQLPVGAALRLGAALSRALAEVHRRGIIHRDVKPQNILVDAELREIRLIDFGIATRRTQKVEAATAVEELAGTLAYMAPEQTGRMNRVVDTRADLYAMGATLYQMLTGALPFESDDAMELIHAHAVKLPPPPHERAPSRQIPEVVSAIVLKLMANSPEDRYQTAEGVAFDLEQAARAWDATGAAPPFTLAARDWEDRIRRPSRLFGREREAALLEESFARACGGEVVLALVAGPSGVGKSALVDVLRARARAHGAIFTLGKFDQLQRSTPFSALAQALRSVVRKRLGDPAEALARWKSAWLDAAGPNGEILTDLIPELVHILGKPKPLIEVSPLEARSRFQSTVQRFAGTIATQAHPWVLFIDDLQWADPASLSLLQALLTDPEIRHLLVVGAYRDDEANGSHPLHGLFEAAKGKAIAASLLTLAPLDEAALTAMVADMLDRPPSEVTALARLVKEKTDGSPFFVGQILQRWHEQRLLLRDAETGQWRWQEEAIDRADITDNVVALLSARFENMSPALREVLPTAACIGNRFELGTLALVTGQRPEELRAALEEAVHEGLLRAEVGDAGHDEYAFVHDRVQQAVYEARSPEERLRAHLSIGRQLRARYGALCSDDEVLETVYHRNLSSALLIEAEEKRDLAAQNLRAGQRAKASTAYTEAVEFLKVGQALLGEAGWAEAEALTFETHLCLAESLLLSGQREQGDLLFSRCIERGRDDLTRARVVSAFLPLLSFLGETARGIELGLQALAWLGRPLPGDVEAQQALNRQMLEELEAALERMTAADWSALVVSADRAHVLVCKILEELAGCASYHQPLLSRCCMIAILIETLRHGLAKNSLTGFMTMALVLAYAQGKIAPARRLVEATLPLVEQHDLSRTMAFYTAAFATQYWAPLARARELLRRGEQAALEEGRGTQAELANFALQYIEMLSGAYLPRLVHAARASRYRSANASAGKMILSLSLSALFEPPTSKEEDVGSSRVDLQACKLEYSIVSPK